MTGDTSVVLVAGFGAPSRSLTPLRAALQRAGADVRVAPTGLNLDCGEATVRRLVEHVRGIGRSITLIGHSRGGQLARVIAVRHPELVERLITVGTPWTIGPPDRPGVAMGTAMVRGLRRLGVPVMGSIDCAAGECCTDYRRDLTAPLTVRWVAVWSSRDRVAGEDSRPPTDADVVLDVDASHLGLVRSEAGVAAIRSALNL
ncbi:MAG TPA: alpha/beta hydrolase [Acidimicrobiales bacterium]|nr:alpha/beta hydrolase [Acidimicrobiales bacterium]